MNTIACTDIAKLRSVPAGTLTALEGDILTLRDRSLARLAELKKNGEPLPVDLTGRIIFFAGPTPGFADGHGSVGPTTSRRMTAYLPLLADLGVVALIGKGPLDKAALDLLAAHRILYLQAAGGAGAFYGKRITSIKSVAFQELGSEGVFELTVYDFIVMMSLDGRGAAYL